MAGMNDLELHHALKLLLNGCELCGTLAIRKMINGGACPESML